MKFSTLALPCLAAWPLLQSPALAAQSAPNAIDDRLQHCLDDPTKVSTGDQDDCIDQAGHEWDALLNQDYKILGDRLAPDARAKLRDAQRAWLRSRDADRALIEAVFQTTSGTMYAPMNANDIMELTAARARRLDGYLATAAVPMPTLPPLDNPDNGARRPHRAADEAKRCPAATEACAERLAPLYAQDLAEVESALSRRLPRAARPSFDRSRTAWSAFRDQELILIDALASADAPLRKLGLSVERLGALEEELGMIGAGTVN